MKANAKLNDRIGASAMGARAFYFIIYGLFYVALIMYKNPMRDILSFQKEESISLGDIVWVIYYIGIHYAAIHYFLTTGQNPGFVDETETEIELKAKEMLRISH